MRSLSFGDEDYEGHVLSILKKMVDNNLDNFDIIIDYVRTICPESGEYISSKNTYTRKIFFSPNVFNVPDGVVDYFLVSIMTPFSERFIDVYDTIKSAISLVGLTCKRAVDMWENAAIIQDIFELIFRSYIVILPKNQSPSNAYEKTK